VMWGAVITTYDRMFRSRYEMLFSEWLAQNGLYYSFEKYGFRIGETGEYTPDFYVWEHGVFIETQGKWGVGGQTKLGRFRLEYPTVPLLVVPWTLSQEFFDLEGEDE